MRSLRAVAVCCFVFALAVLAISAGEGQSFGKGLTGPEVTKISDILAKPELYEGKTVRVEGLVTEVCLKRGCWMMIASDKEFQALRIKVEDGEIVFPPEAKGKRAIAEGVFTKTELTREQALNQAKHRAEEQGQKFDPETAKDIPTVVYQIQATGAVVR
jgi:hypothetical protein